MYAVFGTVAAPATHLNLRLWKYLKNDFLLKPCDKTTTTNVVNRSRAATQVI